MNRGVNGPERTLRARFIPWLLGGAVVVGCIAFESLFADWLEEGSVRIEAGSEHLELTGVPGDRIRLVLPLPADAEADYSETSIVTRDTDTGVEIVTRLAVELDKDYPNRVFAWLAVPDLEGKPSRTIEGIVSGYATTGRGTVGHLEVPFTLRIEPRGRIATSGAKDMTWQTLAQALWLVALMPVVVGVIRVIVAMDSADGTG